MSLVNAVWYYSSAKPESGYSAAVRGYACKLAQALGYEAEVLESDDAQALSAKAVEQGAPQVIIGAGEEMNWPSGESPTYLKARPYADQHGHGPSMHALTFEQLELAHRQAQTLWGMLPEPVVMLCLANPNWLVSELEEWVGRFQTWLKDQQVQTLCVTNSPRTNPLLWEAFNDALAFDGRLICNDCRGEQNLYLEMLSVADAIVLMGSSRSMAAEAVMTRAPIYYRADDAESHQRFFEDIKEKGSLADRYEAFDFQSVTWGKEVTACDVTQPYVEQAVAMLKASQAA